MFKKRKCVHFLSTPSTSTSFPSEILPVNQDQFACWNSDKLNTEMRSTTNQCKSSRQRRQTPNTILENNAGKNRVKTNVWRNVRLKCFASNQMSSQIIFKQCITSLFVFQRKKISLLKVYLLNIENLIFQSLPFLLLISTKFINAKFKIFYFILLLLIFNRFTTVTACTAKRSHAGCQQLRLCCAGRNQTCKTTYDLSDSFDVRNSYESSYPSRRHSRSSGAENAMLKLFQFKANELFPIVLTRHKKRTIGNMILPNLIALNDVGQKYARKYGLKGYLQVVERNLEYKNVQKVKRQTDPTYSVEDYFVFGPETELDGPSPERTLFQRGRPIIRYSLLNKYLPLRIGKTRYAITTNSKKTSNQYDSRKSTQEINDDSNENLRVMYVTEAEAQCYCDAACIKYNDCCFDYVQFCKPVIPEPCYFSQWSSWSECRASNSDLNEQIISCGGEGIQYRSRKAIRGAENIACTRRHRLTENRGCFETCKQNSEFNQEITFKQEVINTTWDSKKITSTVETMTIGPPLGTVQLFKDSMENASDEDSFTYGPRKKGSDITTVALLLDYRYNETRMVHHKYDYRHKPLHHQSQFDNSEPANPLVSENTTSNFQLLPEDDQRFEKENNIFYCVRYELGWVNRNCFGRDWQKTLHRKNIICVECQPHAQLHRNTPRCASDLQDGEKGFWKLIGPRYCYGIWRRISRTDNCYCYNNFPQLTPFLIV